MLMTRRARSIFLLFPLCTRARRPAFTANLSPVDTISRRHRTKWMCILAHGMLHKCLSFLIHPFFHSPPFSFFLRQQREERAARPNRIYFAFLHGAELFLNFRSGKTVVDSVGYYLAPVILYIYLRYVKIYQYKRFYSRSRALITLHPPYDSAQSLLHATFSH